MALPLHRRGPDGFGCWFDAGSGFGFSHNRLAVVDLSPAGSQPMHSACNRYAIVFNGEIYNHLSLRDELLATGFEHPWRGRSDTETLLAAISFWGVEKTLRAVVGMFAFALWDKEKRTLTLARDRMGEKPLYWGWQNGILFFASDLKAIESHPSFVPEIDRGALAIYLRLNYLPAPFSIYTGIEKLSAGKFVSISLPENSTRSEARSYWSINRAIQAGETDRFQGRDSDAVDQLETCLLTSIRGQMVADVPLGAFLSGGVDSSLVSALMQNQSRLPVRTFAIGFGDPDYNEAPYAREVARYLGTSHTELYVGDKEALAVVPQLASIYSEPFADSSQIPTFLVSQMARQSVTVALSGDGGDELFGGYNPYRFAPHIWGRLAMLPLPFRRSLQRLMQLVPLPAKLAKLQEVLAAVSREDFYRLLASHWKAPEQIVIGATEYPTILDSPAAWTSTDCFEHWMMAIDAQMYMPDDILVKVDRAAMFNSLETRVPLLDHRVVELAWRLPFEMKVRNGRGKWVLREVLYRHVPRSLIDRPKKGFSVPLAEWLRGPLRSWAEDLLSRERLHREGYLQVDAVWRAWQMHLSGTDCSTRLWSVLMFQAWLAERSRSCG